MSKVDRDWALDEIAKFMHASDQVDPNKPGSGVFFMMTVQREGNEVIAQHAHVVEQILDRVLPKWRVDRPAKDVEWAHLREWASRAKSVVEREAEIAEKLGDGAPEMDAALDGTEIPSGKGETISFALDGSIYESDRISASSCCGDK